VTGHFAEVSGASTSREDDRHLHGENSNIPPSRPEHGAMDSVCLYFLHRTDTAAKSDDTPHWRHRRL